MFTNENIVSLLAYHCWWGCRAGSDGQRCNGCSQSGPQTCGLAPRCCSWTHGSACHPAPGEKQFEYETKGHISTEHIKQPKLISYSLYTISLQSCWCYGWQVTELWSQQKQLYVAYRSSDDPVLPCHKLRGSDREVTHFKGLDESLEKENGDDLVIAFCITTAITYLSIKS